MSTRSIATVAKLAAVLVCTAGLAFSADVPGMSAGKVQLKSAGAMAFAPNGVLIVGDSTGGSVVALDVKDGSPANSGGNVQIKGINEKIAAMVGTTPDQILIQDVTVNPVSKHVYISVSRGRGPDAIPLIFWTDASGKLNEVPLDNVAHTMVSLPDAPSTTATNSFGQNQRTQTITSLAYVDGNVIVAGLSNEEFSSTLHSIPFPFRAVDKGTGVKIYHSSHAEYETEAPDSHLRSLSGEQPVLYPGRLHLHSDRGDSGVRPEAGQQGDGYHGRKSWRGQPSAGHDCLH